MVKILVPHSWVKQVFRRMRSGVLVCCQGTKLAAEIRGLKSPIFERLSAESTIRYAVWNSALRSAMISVWMLAGTGLYRASSMVKVPSPCVMLRRSVE